MPMLLQLSNWNGLWYRSSISPKQRVSGESLEKDSKVILTCVQVQGPYLRAQIKELHELSDLGDTDS